MELQSFAELGDADFFNAPVKLLQDVQSMGNGLDCVIGFFTPNHIASQAAE
jgi:hypothetical protein